MNPNKSNEQALREAFADAIEKIAFEIPAPNPYTPRLIQLCITARTLAAQATPQPQSVRDALEKAAIEVISDYFEPDTTESIAKAIVALIKPLSAATDGQESEAQETAKQRYDKLEVDKDETSSVERLRAFCSLAMNGQDWLDVEPFFDALTAPPSAIAIETTAKLQAAEVLEGWAETAEAFGFDGDAKNYRDIKAEILATIPQDSITELEKFGMDVAEAVRYRLGQSGTIEIEDFQAIVKSLIGGTK